MSNDLIDGFSFSVYDEAFTKYDFVTDGLWHDIQGVPWRYSMWLTCPDGVPGINPGRLLVELQHAPGTCLTRTEDERTSLPRQMGYLFCTFVQGVVLGWETIEHNVVVVGQRRDQIPLHVHSQGKTIDQLVALFGLTDRAVRRLCRDDVLHFAVEQYEARGAFKAWTVSQFLDTGVSRLPYTRDCVHGVVRDLLYEHKLAGAKAAPPEGPSAWLIPDKYDAQREGWEAAISRWHERLAAVGQKQEWVRPRHAATRSTLEEEPQMDEPKVFIIHGHDEAKRRELKELLEHRFGLEGVIMQEQAGRSRTFIEKFEAVATPCNAAIALLTADDLVTDEGEEYGQPRPNVLFELGWFAGRLGRSRTLMVVRQGTQLPSDLYGIEVIFFQKNVSEQIPRLEKEILVWKEQRPDGAPAPDQTSSISVGMRAARSLLGRASQHAREAGKSILEFPVPISELRGAGVSDVDLRRLLIDGLVDHCRGVTRPGVNGIALQRLGNTEFGSESCFVLTDKGERWLKSSGAGQTAR